MRDDLLLQSATQSLEAMPPPRLEVGTGASKKHENLMPKRL